MKLVWYPAALILFWITMEPAAIAAILHRFTTRLLTHAWARWTTWTPTIRAVQLDFFSIKSSMSAQAAFRIVLSALRTGKTVAVSVLNHTSSIRRTIACNVSLTVNPANNTITVWNAILFIIYKLHRQPILAKHNAIKGTSKIKQVIYALLACITVLNAPLDTLNITQSRINNTTAINQDFAQLV